MALNKRLKEAKTATHMKIITSRMGKRSFVSKETNMVVSHLEITPDNKVYYYYCDKHRIGRCSIEMLHSYLFIE